MEKTIEPVQFTKDKPIIVLVVVNAALSFITLVATFILLKSHDFKVPVQYIKNDGSVLQTSNWYTLYSLPFFSLLSLGAMIFIAHRLHKGNRLFAIGALAVYVIVSVVTLITTFDLLSLVSKI